MSPPDRPLSDGGAVRCRGEPITVTAESETGDDVEYFPAEQTVRVVATKRGDEAVHRETVSLERWGEIEGTSAALEGVREVTAERLGTDSFCSGMGRPPEGVDTEGLVVTVSVTTQMRDGEVVSTPDVSLEALADAAPRSVDATLTVEGDTVSRTVPVFARRVTEETAGPLKML